MKKATNKYGIDYIITVTNKDNERPVEQMVGKAMCAYANWQEAEKTAFAVERRVAHRSEYEATVRCIAMFVDQPTSCICGYVIARVEEEFGI